MVGPLPMRTSLTSGAMVSWVTPRTIEFCESSVMEPGNVRLFGSSLAADSFRFMKDRFIVWVSFGCEIIILFCNANNAVVSYEYELCCQSDAASR